jgi:hypothetical protein
MAKMSISVVKGRGSMAHNNRNFTTQNVDKNRVKDNITYKAEPIEQAYEKCFGAEVERYNSTQKRADRRIGNYMDYIRNSKNGEKLFYETVVQVGNKFDCAVGTRNGELAKRALQDYMQDFQRRNPNLYMFNAVLHMDEATPHLHIDYIPLAHGYQRGLQVRNSLDKALKEQGIDGKANKKENSTHNWQEAEKNALEGFMRAYGLERAEEKGIKREHMSIDQYKAVAEQIHNEVRELPTQIKTAPTILNKERVIVKKSDLEALEQRAKLSLVHEKATEELQKSIEKTEDDGQKYVINKMRMSLMNLDYAEKQHERANEEYKKAMELRKEAEKMVKAQESLNKEYIKLNEDCLKLWKAYKKQKQTIESLQNENTSLKAQIADLKAEIEQRVQMAVEPLQKQIKGFKERIDDMCQSITNIVKAYAMLKYDKENGYKVQLDTRQGRLFDAVENYAKQLLRLEGKEKMAVEIDKKIGFSKGIRNEIEALTPDISYDMER